MLKCEYTDEEIQDLTDRVFLLKEQIEAGKIHFAEHLIDGFRSSYEAIRICSNGLVDPYSVDGRIRAATKAVQAFRDRSEAKNAVSLAEIQETYFNILFHQFGWLYEQMQNAKLTPSDMALAILRDTNLIDQITKGLPKIAEHLTEFWKIVDDPGLYHLQDGSQLKATFAGDLFPAHWENAVSTAGLYIDTIVLPCPIMRIAPLAKVMHARELAAIVIKHTLTAMTYKSLATADIIPPIVVILPNLNDIQAEDRSGLMTRAEPSILKHGAYLFGRDFTALEELAEYCASLKTVEAVVKVLKRPDRLLFDTNWGGDAGEQLSRAMKEQKAQIPMMDPLIAGNHVYGTCHGRMLQALAAQDNAINVGGSPLINAETSWRYYTWLLEYESIAGVTGGDEGIGLHVSRALTSEAGNNLSWLGHVPPETVLEIRKNGLAEELRNLLGQGVSELVNAAPDNYNRTTDKVVNNLDVAFREHQRKLLEARQQKLKLYGLDVGGCIATGAIAVTAALTGNPTLGVVSSLISIFGLPNLKDIKSKFKEQAEGDRARKQSPTGLLFRHIKQ